MQHAEKNKRKPHLSKYWKIPPKEDAAFVACMEGVLDVYSRPYNKDYPVVCMEESSIQLIGEVRTPLPAIPGHPILMDDEYVRNGIARIFIEVEPLAGKRHVKITDRRSKIDWAQFIKELQDERYPGAKKVLLVMDQLNTHSTSSLYATFAPVDAKRLCDRLEIHHTPKHGSWLNISEMELSVLKRQCLSRRIDNKAELNRTVQAWRADRNNRRTPVDWQFKTDDVRIKLEKL